MSDEDRIQDVENVLRLMMKELEDAPFDALFVDGDKDPYNAICLTTWKELLNRNLVSDQGWKQYRFTGDGWLKGVELLNLTADPNFAAQMSNLSATLRGYVTPRPQHDVTVDIFTVGADSGLTDGFVYNAISTRLLDHAYARDGGAYFDPGDQNKHLIIVPYNYGLRPLLL